MVFVLLFCLMRSWCLLLVSWCGRFVQQKLGGPSVSEYEKLQAELSDLQSKYDDLLSKHQETCKEVCTCLVIC